MRRKDGRRWTILFIRQGTTESHSFELSEGKAALLLSALVLTVAALFLIVGRWTQGAREEAQIEQLKTRVAVLSRENAGVVELADRLEELEQTYSRFQRILGGTSSESDGQAVAVAARAQPSDRSVDAGQTDGDRTVPHAWPIVEQGYVTRQYGDGGHEGLDIAVPTGSYVRASGDGVIVDAAEDPEYGMYVRIEHADRLSSLYAHNSWMFVQAGDSVERGEIIALSGNTGRSTAPHLHMEIERDGEKLDPMLFIGGGD
jgi:murein DD-endopeptidase MepM/ murein hydrolase activator NlpD